ncbi:tubulin-tyrosine ligase family domain-containing protein [Phthorimaea operculella]|nr:tubulin-tyrosine ligase family domain-containing protein [Phthorimaea operculella]
MRFEIPECKRCCCCVPLRYGLLTWSYLILAPFTLMLTSEIMDFMYIAYYYQHYGWILGIMKTCLLFLTLANLAFTVLLIVAAHKKCSKLMRIYNKCALGTAIANLIALITNLVYLFIIFGVFVLFFWSTVLMFLLMGLIFIGLQMYILALVRSEIIKLERNVGFEFHNIGAEAEKEYYEPDTVKIDNQKEYYEPNVYKLNLKVCKQNIYKTMADTKLDKVTKQDKQIKDIGNKKYSQNTKIENKKESQNVTQIKSPKNESSTNVFLIICVIGVLLAVVIQINLNYSNSSKDISDKPKYRVHINQSDAILKHLHLVLGRLGYERTSDDNWDLLWSFPYPFTVLKSQILSMRSHQKVNHFPGVAYITNKVDLATTKAKYIPKAFRLPKEKEDFLKYAAENPKAVFVEKNNQHRQVVLKNVTDMSMEGDKFVQEYVPNPFLVDGYKFDIGVYVVVTSVDPLRLYHFSDDVLFRYCPEKYYPFDPTNIKKYVIADDYRPTWRIPALEDIHIKYGYGMKDAFDIYARAKGKNPDKMWQEVYKAIREIFVKKEKHIIEALQSYPSNNNFFEMFRVDLMLDEDLNVYLLEANMSPNLSSPKQMNQLLYEQVLYSLFSIVGLGSPLHKYRTSFSGLDCDTTDEATESCNEKRNAANMLSAFKNIAVWGNECAYSCKDSCGGVCALCASCLNPADRNVLRQAFREHAHRGGFRRLFPPPMVQNSPIADLDGLSARNKWLYMWYQGKCNTDVAWCT